MKKYLLFTTVASHTDDDDMIINSGAVLIGSFDTIEECIREARQDLLNEAGDVATDATSGDNEEEVQNYIDRYLENTTSYDLDESSFARIGESRDIIESEYHSDYWCDSRVYTVVRIA